MNASARYWLHIQVLAVATFITLTIPGCGERPPSGCGSHATTLEELIGVVFERSESSQPFDDENSVHPYSQEEMYIEIVSESEVRVHYERGGDVVVERFSVAQEN